MTVNECNRGSIVSQYSC